MKSTTSQSEVLLSETSTEFAPLGGMPGESAAYGPRKEREEGV